MDPVARMKGGAVGLPGMAVRLLLCAVAGLSFVDAAGAQSPLVEELRTFSTQYDKNPARLDAIRNGLERAAATDPRADTYVALAQVCFIWGDIRATTRDAKLAAYEEGRGAAQHAIELDPKSAAAHFWYATDTGRWAQTKGVLRSLFLLPTIREQIQIVLDLDPHFTAVYALAGNVFYEVPGLFGGDLDKAEAMFRKGLAQDPRFTGMRVGLAKTLIKLGRTTEARRELQAVLAERGPTNPADWAMRDSPEAKQLLESTGGRP